MRRLLHVLVGLAIVIAGLLVVVRVRFGGSSPRGSLPERFAFIQEVPKTSVGKFDKKMLRARHAEGGLAVVARERG